MQSPDSQLITHRFFLALDTLIATGSLRGRKTFCDRYSINRRNLYAIEHTPDRYALPTCLLSYLVQDYAISPLWLLTGKGKMLRKT